MDENESEGHGSITLTNERKKVRCAFTDLICKKNQMVSQKTKWLGEEDCNTTFFHSLVNSQRSRTIINKLERADGSIISDREQIELHLIEFFQKLYSKNDRGGWGIGEVDWRAIDRVYINRVSMTELEESFF